MAKGGRRLPELTWRQLAQIERQLMARLRSRGEDNVVAVGVGRKNAHTKRPGPVAAVFLCRRKLPERDLPKSRRLGKHRRIQVTVGQGKRRRRLMLATDVIQVPKLVPVALSIVAGADNGTTGLIARWRRNGQRQHGVLTAGHVARGGAGAMITSASRVPVFASSSVFVPDDPATAPFDVALLRFSVASVRSLNPGLAWPDPPALPVPGPIDFEGTTDDGDCQTTDRDVPIDIAQAFATGVHVNGWPKLGQMLGFVATAATASHPFHPGTSGSAVRDRTAAPLAILIAADLSTHTMGFAHPLSKLIRFLQEQVSLEDLEIIGFC